ncbi:INCENP_ARK-bind domain-containing protein [Trichonephila inaurata madagascariensis]|uniref:INCENP_ARK-bind domain-containing protein n=1 Tax=Trichonephila inaurata madagascariensis TaxID=2747483 RepID=A0A8X6YWR3_9ARAC|nr:INCENP_ARK-bind domain-containing protein [Trichonephila inaurata madagascariensis]
MDFLKAIKEKALAIVACKSLKDLEMHFMSEKTKSNLKTLRIPWEESKVHLHSNRNSKENSSKSTDECTPQVTPTSSDSSQNSGSTNVDSGKDNLYQGMCFNTDGLKYCSNFNTSQNTQVHRQNFEECYESSSFENNIKISNVHSVSTSVEISSKSSSVNDSNDVNSEANITYEEYQNVDIMRKIETNNEDRISKETVTVSTLIKTSFTKFSSENTFEKVHDNVANDSVNPNCENEDCNPSSIATLQSNDVNLLAEENFNNDGSHLNKPNVKGISSFIPVKDPKIGYGNISDTETIKTGVDVSDSTCNKKLMQIKNFESKKRLLQKPASLKRASEKIKTFKISSNAENSNIHESEGENFNGSREGRSGLSPMDPKLAIPHNLLSGNNEDSEMHSAQDISVVPQITIPEGSSTKYKSNNLDSVCFSESNSYTNSNETVNSHNEKNSTEIDIMNLHSKKKQESRKTKMSNVLTVPGTESFNAPSMNQKCNEYRFKNTYLHKSHLTAKTGYNLRSHESRKIGIPSTLSESSKNLLLKKNAEEKKKLREQRMKLTQERRERLEKERREKLRRSESRRIRRFKQHEDVLKRKKVDPKQKAVCEKINTTEKSSKGSLKVISAPQASETARDRTYLIESNLNDLSNVTEDVHDRSNNDDLNSLLAHDKKLFMRQSVVLTNIAETWPSELLQNVIHMDFEDKNDQNCRLENNSLNETNNIKISNKSKKNPLGVLSPKRNQKKRHIRSTRKISVSPNDSKDFEKNDGKIKKKLKTSENNGRLKSLSKQESNPSSTTQSDQNEDNDINVNISSESNNKTHTNDSLISNSKQQHENEKNKIASIDISADLLKDPKLSMTPRVSLKKLSKCNSKFLQHLNYSTPKLYYTTSSEEIIRSDPKLSVLKPGVVLKDISNINSKSTRHFKNKNLEGNIKKRTRGLKRESQHTSSYTKLKKKPIIINSMSIKAQKESKRKNQSSDVSSYEISDTSNNSFNNNVTKHKKIPPWASGIYLKKLLLKQYYESPDTDEIFGDYRNQKAIDLADIFTTDKSLYHKRTSSANWSNDESPN